MTFRQLMQNNGVRVLNDDYVQWRSCQRKRRYSHLEDARAVIKRVKHGRVYECRDCLGYHVGHTNHEISKI